MSRTRIIILTSLIILILITILITHHPHPKIDLSPDSTLPFDHTITTGQLENNLTYYIKQNKDPKDIAYLLLAVNVGSVNEDDHQQGLAHFLEHSVFNGSEHFPGKALMDYLNSVGSGMQGGSNAETGFDDTVYILETKTTDPEQLDKFFQILSDFAAYASLENDAIDKERGIILEEKRLDNDASSRMLDQLYEYLLYGSKYSKRLPIGDPEIVAHFPYQTLKDFYNDWYRPDLQAVIAVGDFDVQKVKALIEKHFSDIPQRDNPRERVYYDVPQHEDTKIAIITDGEAAETEILIYYKSPNTSLRTVGDYRKNTVLDLLTDMFYKRLSDITNSANPPFLEAYAWHYYIAHPQKLYTIGATVDENQVMQGFTALITEIERVKQHGFSASELEMSKSRLLSEYKMSLSEKDKTNSSDYAWALAEHFSNGTQVMNIDYEYQLVKALLKDITLEDIRTAINTYITEDNRVVAYMGAETPIFPSVGTPFMASEILNMFTEIQNTPLQPYSETIIDQPLLAKTPKKVKTKKPTHDLTLDTYTWSLPNGATVHLKPTDFKNNEINLNAFRSGGLSHADDDIYPIARFAAEINDNIGRGVFDINQLNTYLSDKDIYYHGSISNNYEQITAKSSVGDLETMLQMLYLDFTQPRYDETGFEIWKARKLLQLKNQEKDPEHIFYNTVDNLLYDSHLRGKEPTADDLVGTPLAASETAHTFYKSRFGSANDFHFVFVGNITPKDLQPFIEKYIATLPNKQTSNEIIDRNLRLSERTKRENIYKGQEMSRLVMQFNNSIVADYAMEQKINLMSAVFQEMIYENIREKMSGVYIIYTYPYILREQSNQVANFMYLGCDPNRVEEIITEAKRQVRLLLANDYEELFYTTAKETLRKDYEQKERDNEYWLSIVKEQILYGFSSSEITGHIAFLDTISREDIADMAKICFDLEKCVMVVQYPEKK